MRQKPTEEKLGSQSIGATASYASTVSYDAVIALSRASSTHDETTNGADTDGPLSRPSHASGHCRCRLGRDVESRYC